MERQNRDIISLLEKDNKKKKTATDVVIDKIKSLLLAKELKPGDLIPPENELANAMNVSRGSVREAMKVLSAFGIVEIKRGNGTYIASEIGEQCLDPLIFGIIYQGNDIEEMRELRELFELGVIKDAIKHVTEEECNEIQRILDDFEEKITEPDFDEQIIYAHEEAFHRALGRATHNRLIEYMYTFLLKFMQSEIKVTTSKFKTAAGQNTLKIHKKIFEGLKEKDFRKATKAVSASVSTWHKYYIE